MGKENTRFPEPKELVGSVDLREAFKDGKRVQGSFYINGVEIHQMSANSPQSIVSQINSKSGATFVTAEIDDGGHLVLVDRSGADIVVSPGNEYAEPAAQSTGDAAKDAVLAMKKAAQDEGDKKEKKNVLELMGLPMPKDGSGGEALAQAGTPMPGFETGLSAEDRKKRWQKEAGLDEDGKPVGVGHEIYPSVQAGSRSGGAGGIDKRGAPQIPSNPTPGNANAAGGKLDDGRGRQGTGGGQGETAGATIERTHQGQHDAPVPGA